MSNLTPIKQEALRELVRRDFWRFCLYYDYHFFKSRPFLKEVAVAFQRVENREINSLSVSLPPRAGKSYITSLFCAWTLGRNPHESIMRNCCTATLYQKFSYDVRKIVSDTKFSSVFLDVKLASDKKNLLGWNTNKAKQVSYFGSGVGGTIIGFGASNVAITDDLYRGIEDAMSDTMNDRILQWKESTHDSRFETGCARIDIGTRWTINDAIGRNMQRKIYDESIVIAALDAEGNSFCENVKTTFEYQEQKKHMAPEIWSAEFMQEPVDIKGRLFGDIKTISNEEFTEFNKGLRAEEIEGAVAYVDVADEGADYLASAVAQKIRGSWFITDYMFTRENTDITMPTLADKLNRSNVSYVRIESNAMGAMFARGVQKMTKAKVLPIHNTRNKETRIIMESAFVMSEFTFVKKGDAQSEQFIQNVLAYSKEGKNKHDDAADCIAGLSFFIRSLFKLR